MKNSTMLLALLFLCVTASAYNDPAVSADKAEVRLYKDKIAYHSAYQQELRNQLNWQNFSQEFGNWHALFNERNQLPHRSFGTPIQVPGANSAEQAMFFLQNNLEGFQLPMDELVMDQPQRSAKYDWVTFRQTHQGLAVLDSKLLVKLYNGKVVMWGADVHKNISVNTLPTISESAIGALAGLGIENTIQQVLVTGLKILPLPSANSYGYHLVYEVMVKTMGADNVPANYLTLVDAHNGVVLCRTNMVKHSHVHDPLAKRADGKRVLPMGTLLTVQAHVTGTIYPLTPYDTEAVFALPNLQVTINGNSYFTDEDGNITAPVNGPISGQFRLQGPWCRVYTNDDTPGFTQTLAEGVNDVTFDSDSNIKERGAYYHVNQIHDHMKSWLPDFDGMDVQLTTNVDVEGTCNAFYDGASINFYDIGGGCNATSLIGDVVYHEYGHGINDQYYQSMGSNFNNGAMGEGYADWWGMSLTQSALLGIGFYTTNEDPLRRYDIDPKVYPEDLTGEVHADGEIICGAWYDTHLLMGANWDNSMALFIETYAGLQAEIQNGNEGVAYTDVLLDALMADDDDGDLSNGTPNGEAIIEGFDLHGITLLGSAELDHNDLEFATEDEVIVINAEYDIEFPFSQFLQGVRLFYRLNDETAWSTVDMENTGADNYSATIPAQPKGTVVAYYLGLVSTSDEVTGIQPIGAAQPDPNLPYFILVGVEVVGRHDCDDFEDWGSWEQGLVGDNNSTGTWDLDIPIGSFGTVGDFGTVVQPYFQHTPGGEYCFITGNATNDQSPLGENDVDEGHTTLQTAEIEMSEYENPVVAYWRWYTNNPPSGANPGADWWQVRLSDDGGDTWTYVENSKTSDRSWRRNAFRLLDYVDATDQVMLEFIASDSTHIGEELDGGSLIEAGLDDFVVYDEDDGIGVTELDQIMEFSVYPNPAKGMLWIDFAMLSAANVSMEFFNGTGQLVERFQYDDLPCGNHRKRVNLKEASAGIYLLKLTAGSGSRTLQVIVE